MKFLRNIHGYSLLEKEIGIRKSDRIQSLNEIAKEYRRERCEYLSRMAPKGLGVAAEVPADWKETCR